MGNLALTFTSLQVRSASVSVEAGLSSLSSSEFLVDSSAYGNWGKVIVHEWAKLRWGVFEEHGYPGDPQFPMFFYKVRSPISPLRRRILT